MIKRASSLEDGTKLVRPRPDASRLIRGKDAPEVRPRLPMYCKLKLKCAGSCSLLHSITMPLESMCLARNGHKRYRSECLYLRL